MYAEMRHLPRLVDPSQKVSPMPRYFFDFIDDGGRLNDDEGQDLPDADAAYEVAHAMAGNLMQSAQQSLLRCRFEVRDVEGEIVFELPFAEAVTVPDRLN
jgi:hypothetical protein